MTGDAAVKMKAFRTLHDLVKISGEGARDFLQGQLSADMEGLEYEPGAEGAFVCLPSLILQPEGKLVAAVRVMRLSKGHLGTLEKSYGEKSREYVLEVADGFGEEVLNRLKQFSIGANCDMSLGRCDGINLVWNRQNLKEVVIADSRNPDRALEAFYPVIQDDWTDEISSLQLLGVEADLKIASQSTGEVPFADVKELEYLRIACGIPKMGKELKKGLIPAVAGKRFIDENVSFTKGCFVGQELVARMDSRGSRPPQKLVGVKIFSANSEDIGSLEDYSPLMMGAEEVAYLTSLAGVSARSEGIDSESMASDASLAPNPKMSAIGIASAKRLLDTGVKVSAVKRGKAGEENLEVEVCELPLKGALQGT